MSLIDLSPFNNILQRLETVADRLERGGNGGGAAQASHAAAAITAAIGAAGGQDDPAIVQSFTAFMKEKMAPLSAAAKETGSAEVAAATEVIESAFKMLRDVFAATGSAKKPKDQDWRTIFAPVIEVSTKAQKACDNRNAFFQAQKAGAEAMNLVQMVTVNAPGPHVKGVLETCDFHLVKVMQKKNPPETAWAKVFKELLKGLEEWCVENCKMGLVWSHTGQEALDYFSKKPIGSGSGASGGGYPAAAKPKAGGGMASLFGAIAGTGSDERGLKKVSDDMKTKNRAKDDVPPPSAPAPKAVGKAPSFAGEKRKGPKGPPIKELQRDTNWMFENLEGDSGLVLGDEATMSHNVVVINCKNITLQVKTKKVKSICIDGCEKVNVVCGNVLSTVELVNSDRCKVQTIGTVNSFAIDKCNGVGIILSKESIGAELVSSKSSEMNVTIPDQAGEDGDIIELPIPEQFVTKVTGPKKLTTEVSSLYS